MLVRFSFSNWMSFREEATFNMIASLERQHGARIPRIKKYRTKVLPIAALFGGNASGKSNFVKALQFSQEMIVTGTKPDRPILVKPFKLDPQSQKRPTKFRFELLLGKDMYEFEFSVTRKEVLDERLVKISSTGERELYHRSLNKTEFHPSLKVDLFLGFVAQGTRSNELLLTKAISQNVDMFRPVHDWFADSLVLLAPDDRLDLPRNSIEDSPELHAHMSFMLPRLDTGISRFDSKDVGLEDTLMPKPTADSIKESLKEGETLWFGPGYHFTALRLQDGELIGTMLQSFHTNSEGEEIQFELEEEADGTRRVIEMLPILLALSAPASEKTFVIDEIDRSLHSLLTSNLIHAFLSTCSENSRSQLLFTTHDLLLMDQKLLRRDEMWLTERNQGGVSQLTSIGDFKDTRYDKDIRKSYLQGRMGGIPSLLLASEGLLTETDYDSAG